MAYLLARGCKFEGERSRKIFQYYKHKGFWMMMKSRNENPLFIPQWVFWRWWDQWDFSEPPHPIRNPTPIFESLKIWEACMGPTYHKGVPLGNTLVVVSSFVSHRSLSWGPTGSPTSLMQVPPVVVVGAPGWEWSARGSVPPLGCPVGVAGKRLGSVGYNPNIFPIYKWVKSAIN